MDRGFGDGISASASPSVVSRTNGGRWFEEVLRLRLRLGLSWRGGDRLMGLVLRRVVSYSGSGW